MFRSTEILRICYGSQDERNSFGDSQGYENIMVLLS